MSIATVLPFLMWLPPLAIEVPQQFYGLFAVNLEQCGQVGSISKVRIQAKEIEWAGRSRLVEELFLIDPEKLAVRLSALPPQPRKASAGVIMEVVPDGVPATLLVILKRAEGVEVGIAKTSSSDGQTSLSFTSCGEVLSNAPNK